MNVNTDTKLFSKEFTRNPYPAYERLRQEEPLCKMKFPDGQDGWLVTKYEDAVELLKDSRIIKDPSKLFGGNMEYRSVFMHNMLFSDPPEHKRLRGLAQKAFTPQMIMGMKGRIEEIARELLNESSGKQSINLIDDFAFPLPIIVISEILGVPAEDRDKFRIWSNSIIDSSNGENPEQVLQHINEFISYLSEWFQQVKNKPGEDLISQLVLAEEEGDSLTERELFGLVTLLIIAGHETTVNLIGNTVLAFLENPDQLQLLIERPELISNSIEESLRYNGPVEFSTSRWANEDIEFKGKTIRRGELITIALNSANHDPEQFDQPEVFDILREKSPHLAFGKGIHLCLGAPLARLEGEIALRSLLQTFPDMQLAVDAGELEWRPGMIVRGVKEIPLHTGK
ncbi:cytochrome P450 [Bacillus lacus]|uniref:Cytochrome P450 n=1 Tax=Metabacillus lacus TaxID=1983721 RepID=A0A7X2M081_9BACI|nr:cytochrome P450 [Metabacillus lacus]MRX73793.1 cytochrome P450 [Metabacillus lacus]